MCKSFIVLATVATYGVLTGCAISVPTTSYMPQNIVRYEYKNSVDMGVFTYEPEIKKIVEANQVQLVGLGEMYISTSVSEMVKRATGLELEKTGVVINELSEIVISGDVLELKANVIGLSMTWDYIIRYKILQKKDQRVLLSKEFKTPTKRTGKFNQPADYAYVLHDLVLTGYDMFIRDPEVRRLLDVPPL